MKLHPTVLVVATAVLTGLTGCGVTGAATAPTTSSIPAGMGSPESAGAAAEQVGSTREQEPADPAQQEPAGSAPRQTPTHRSTPSHAPKPHGPRIVSFKVVQKPKCAEGTAVFRAEAVPLVIKWKITGADSAALSVDDPTGTPGTYGAVGLQGTQEFTFSCTGAVGSTETHTYAIYTVGGGAQRHKTLKVSAKVLDKGVEVG